MSSVHKAGRFGLLLWNVPSCASGVLERGRFGCDGVGRSRRAASEVRVEDLRTRLGALEPVRD